MSIHLQNICLAVHVVRNSSNFLVFRTVVKVTVGKSQMLYSSMTKRSKDKNSGLLTVGAVNIDIPQHPVALHGMMTRGSKQLSSTLQVRILSNKITIVVSLLSYVTISFLCFRNYAFLAPRAVSVEGWLPRKVRSRRLSSRPTHRRLLRAPAVQVLRPPLRGLSLSLISSSLLSCSSLSSFR